MGWQVKYLCMYIYVASGCIHAQRGSGNGGEGRQMPAGGQACPSWPLSRYGVTLSVPLPPPPQGSRPAPITAAARLPQHHRAPGMQEEARYRYMH